MQHQNLILPVANNFSFDFFILASEGHMEDFNVQVLGTNYSDALHFLKQCYNWNSQEANLALVPGAPSLIVSQIRDETILVVLLQTPTFW
jgi:hypothetical protein